VVPEERGGIFPPGNVNVPRFFCRRLEHLFSERQFLYTNSEIYQRKFIFLPFLFCVELIDLLKGGVELNKNTLEDRFSAACRYVMDREPRGLQARICRETHTDPANLNAIVKKGRGTSEQLRRDIFQAIKRLADIPACTYDEFLEFGRWILEGNQPESWQSPQLLRNSRIGEIDADLLEAVVGAVEEYLDKTKKVVPARKKAALIVTLFNIFSRKYGARIDKSVVAELTELAG
jgi:hypothetical protein